jgi:lysophospholipase L1-like esterase
MKTILCFGDSNTWGCRPLTSLENIPRYGPDVRWGSVLRTSLGEGYWVIEEGLNGRTTVWADPVEGEYKSGKSYLTACLESHAPLDLVTILLGTNDLKHRFGLSAWDIAACAGVLVQIVQSSAFGPNGSAPRVLLICPPPVTKLTLFAGLFEVPLKNRSRWPAATAPSPPSTIANSWTPGSILSPATSMASTWNPISSRSWAN